MNILSVYWGHHHRGCWKRLWQILDYLANQGHHIWLLVSQENPTVTSPNVQVILINFPLPFLDLSEIYFGLVSPLTAILINLVFPIDVLLAFDGHNAGLLSLSRALFKKTRLILCVRSHFIFNNDLGDDPWWLSAFKKKADIWSHSFCDLTIYNCLETANQIEKLYSKPPHLVKVVLNNVQFKNIDLEVRHKLHQQLGIKADDFVIGYCGQLIPRKNLGFLLNAIAEIPRELPIKLLIQGRGVMYDDLVAQTYQLGLENRVFFLPWSDNMTAFYSSLDLFILPSKYDTCSNALLDAIGYNKCVLASNSGGNREILGGDERLLFPLSNHRVLADKIIGLMTDTTVFNESQKAVYIQAIKLNFNWNDVIANLIFTAL
ncbi:glycosyltransferase family 4 protein [Limnospira platensis CENA597]|uniref:glycosyltransferase family 4 protein n=2 Tax=Oscillatoriales TaxID=1150 RepID=UPI003D6FA84F